MEDGSGWTPVHRAAEYGHTKVINALKQRGADIAVKSTGGWTPLDVASRNDHVKAVQVLKTLALMSEEGCYWIARIQRITRGYVNARVYKELSFSIAMQFHRVSIMLHVLRSPNLRVIVMIPRAPNSKYQIS
jgi:ankyrin repeat protein